MKWRMILIMVVLLGSACTGNQLLETSISLEPTTADSIVPPDNFIDNVEASLNACDQPCWNGLMLGITNYEEAEHILSTYYGSENVELYSDVFITWNAVDDPDITDGVIGFFNGTVNSIGVNFKENSVNLGRLIRIVGEPSHVRLWYDHTNKKCFAAEILFPEIRFSVHINLSVRTISETQLTSRINLLSADLLLGPQSFGGDSWVVSWTGFGEYCVTP